MPVNEYAVTVGGRFAEYCSAARALEIGVENPDVEVLLYAGWCAHQVWVQKVSDLGVLYF